MNQNSENLKRLYVSNLSKYGRFVTINQYTYNQLIIINKLANYFQNVTKSIGMLLQIFLQSLGVRLVFCLKKVVKYPGLLKPNSYAISVIFLVGSCNNCFAFLILNCAI